MIDFSNRVIHEFKTNQILDEKMYVHNYLKNKFMKDNYKRISDSYNVIYTDAKEIQSKFKNTIEPSIKKWILHILNYEQGFNFLNDSKQTDKDWDELLSKRKDLNENESPFVKIKIDEIWNW